MLRTFIFVILFFTFSSMSHGKVFDKKKCEEILKKYDVSYQSWNNILNRYLKERENLTYNVIYFLIINKFFFLKKKVFFF